MNTTIRKLTITACVTLAAAGVIHAQQTTSSPQAGKGKVEVLGDWKTTDSIAVRYYGYLVSEGKSGAALAKAVSSPDGRYFFVQSVRGDLPSDSMVGTLEVFESARVIEWISGSAAERLLPVHKLERKGPPGSGTLSGISAPSWGDTSTSILFSGYDPAGNKQIFRLNVMTGALDALTNDPMKKGAFVASADAIVYLRLVNEKAPPGPTPYPVLVLPRSDRGDVELQFAETQRMRSEIAVRYRSDEPWLLPFSPASAVNFKAWFSPDSRFAVLRISELSSDGRTFLPGKYVLVDIQARQMRPMSEAEVAEHPWAHTCTEKHKKSTLPEGLTVQVRQSANEPPSLVAAFGGKGKVLSEPDPALAGIRIAPVEPFTYRSENGRTWTGALALPTGKTKGRIPFVIQIGTDDGLKFFMPDGPVPSGFALQALVARGIAVLSLDYQRVSNMNSPHGDAEILDSINSAINALTREKGVDIDRVGLVGFSNSGYRVFYAITHPKKIRYAAAAVLDSVSFSYPEYLDRSALDAEDSVQINEGVHGGSFWKNKSAWLERDVLFNLDRMETPALFLRLSSMIGSGQSVEDYEHSRLAPYIALGLSKRPFEALYLPNAGHVIHSPRQRLVAMDSMVDWMSFWLQGYEDLDSTKTDQYQRWRRIKERNEQRIAAERQSTSP